MKAADAAVNEFVTSTTASAELSGAIVALEWLASSGLTGTVKIKYDSAYSRHITLGEWKARANFRLAARARRAYAAVVAIAGISLSWHHVDSHTGVSLNERADKLADVGASGASQSLPPSLS